MGRGLSELQKNILCMAYENRMMRRSRSENLIRDDMDLFASEFLEIFFAGKTNAIRAAVSRAFKRLEERGLVKRYWGAYSKWMAIDLTDHGLEKAKELTVNKDV